MAHTDIPPWNRPTARKATNGAGPPTVGPASVRPPPRMGRAIIVGLTGVCLHAFLVQYVGYYLVGSPLGVDYLPIGVFCLFVLLIALNTLLRRVGPGEDGIALRRSELVVAYVTMLVTGDIAGSGFAGRLVPALMSVYRFADSTNDWGVIFHRYIPQWAAPQGKEVLRHFFEGTEGGSVPWGAWLLPLATWLVPWTAMLCLMFGLGILLRKRWLERERLTFPLVQVPLAVLGEEDVPGFNRALRHDVVFWLAFVVPVFLRTLQGLHHYFPAVPFVPLGTVSGVNQFFDSPSWKALFNTTALEIHLALVGIAVLMRAEVSASFWVFEWFYLGIGALLFLAGIGEGTFTNTPRETFGYIMFIYYSRLGGTFVAAAMLLWAAREQIARAWELLRYPERAGDEDDRLLRTAPWLLLVGVVFYFGWTFAGHMSLRASVIMLAVNVAAIIVLARIIADGGLFWASLSLDPMRTTVRYLGTDTMSGRTLTFVALGNHIPMAHRGNILPSIMDGFQLGHKTRVAPSRLVTGMVAGVATAGLFSLILLLWLSYSYGAEKLDQFGFIGPSLFPFQESSQYMKQAAPTNVAAILTTLLGGGLMALFIVLHRRLLWWPVYPFGFAIAESATMEHMWLSVFIGWALHVLIVQIWGRSGYRRIKPAAIGLVVGDFLSIGAWAAVDVVTGSLNNRLSHEVLAW